MKIFKNVVAFMMWIVLFQVGLVQAQSASASRNLVGVKEVQDRIVVSINLKGAEEFKVDAIEVKKIILKALDSSGVSVSSSGTGLPIVNISIAGETAGGGGARFTSELDIILSMPSPFAKNRSIEVILWHESRTREEVMRYDPIAKEMIKPTTAINERVYEAVRELASKLEGDIKKSGDWK